MKKEDATEIERLRKSLEQKTAEVQSVTKELEKFSYSVSHDLRAPLRAIEGFSKILLEDYLDKLDEEGQRFLKIIDASSRKMTHLLDDILMFSRLGRQELHPVRVQMRKVIEAAWNDLGPIPSRKVELKIHSLPDAECDPVLIEHVWKHLLGNALKFTATRESTLIEISGETEGDRVIYRIKDNGIGFDMRLEPKLFGLFQRLHTSEEFSGNGIGLALCQRLIRRHSGEIHARAEPEKGAEFSFSLPGTSVAGEKKRE